MRIYQSMTEMIGRTPLLQLHKFEKKSESNARIYAKLEGFNPSGSGKDRIAHAMIRAAEAAGTLKAGDTIIAPTSGNTGIALSAVGAALGYNVVIVMPENMSKERQKMIARYGAKLILTPAEASIPGSIEVAERLAAGDYTEQAMLAGESDIKPIISEGKSVVLKDAALVDQFSDMANPMIHYTTTGFEIWEDTMGTVDIIVAGIGTGGTITGAGKYIKERKPGARVVAVEPAEIHHDIQGIGDGLVPDVLDTEIYDEVIKIKTEDAYETAAELARTEGILLGTSSGATLRAAAELARRPENKGKRIVAICMDSGDRYLTA